MFKDLWHPQSYVICLKIPLLTQGLQVRIHCAEGEVCIDYDLCVPCFSKGAFSKTHVPAWHKFSVIEQHSIPVYDEDWGADEELLMLEGAETYGLGSWTDIADHIGGYRTKEEVRDHYINTYVFSPNFPLPALADPNDLSLLEVMPREKFQSRKKRRIEDRKEAAKNAPPAPPKQKPTASVPACHEVQGYMPGRLEFETEFYNEAEEAVQHMQFEPGDGMNPRTGEMEPEMELKMAVMDIYNSKLTARTMRKRAIFEHQLLDYRKNAAVDKKRTKEERDLLQKAKPFARIICHDDYVTFSKGVAHENALRQAIIQLQDWRQKGLSDLKSGEKYEAEKSQRAARPPPTGQFDRIPGARPPKPVAPVETTNDTAEMTATELPERYKSAEKPASASNPKLNDKRPLTNGTSNPIRTPYVPATVPGVAPLKMGPSTTDLQLLTPEEKELCSVLRITPKAYGVMKEAIIREATKAGGSLKRKQVREMCKV